MRDHQELALREVHDPHDAENDADAGGHQAIDDSGHQPGDDGLGEGLDDRCVRSTCDCLSKLNDDTMCWREQQEPAMGLWPACACNHGQSSSCFAIDSSASFATIVSDKHTVR